VTQIREYSDVEYVFEPNSTELPDVREYVAAIWERRVFMSHLVRSELRNRGSSTALGNLWSILDPLFQAAIYYFLYTVLRSESAQADFLPVLIGGIFLFQLSVAAFGDAGQSLKRGKGLMLASTFPRAVLPITSVYKAVMAYIPNLCVFAVLFPLVGGEFGAGLLVFPLLFVIQIVMNLGIALLSSSIIAMVPDASNAISYVTRILFFATPVIYPVSLLPDSARALIGWQPLFPLFASYQAVFSGNVPSPALVLQAGASAVILLVAGAYIFLRHEREFGDKL
jgi:ABC-type polysaccharide/polyol phosphate export permease